MSGNPFRASLVLKHPAAPPTSFINTDSSRGTEARDEPDGDAVLDTSTALPAKTKKSVRIESPTEIIPPHPVFHDADSSPIQRGTHGQHAGSLSPMSPVDFSNAFGHTAVDGGKRTEEADARGMTGSSRRSPGSPEATLSHAGAPANPFARTLATIEPLEQGSGEPAGQNRDRTATARATPGATKLSLDVEGFKNLLMTGISSPRNSGQPPPPQAAAAPTPIGASVFESSSSTDTSSISRQSIFEPVQEPHIESPRTSYEMAGSDEDRAKLMGEIKKEKKKPPPTPKHRHGRRVGSRAPQTVAFSDFSAVEPTSSPSPSVRRSNSDLNKPLPPTPPTPSQSNHIVSQDSTYDLPSIPDGRASETASLSDAAPANKKSPPPVPLARRHSQLRTSNVGNRSRSNSALTVSSQQSIEFPLLSPGANQEPMSSSSSYKSPPPPPPTRRHGATLSTISMSSANSSSTELSLTTATARRTTISSPNPPSSRRTTLSSEPPSPSLARTSSTASSRPQIRTISSESSTSLSSMPPPPPPPRRGGRTSLDTERPTISPMSPPDRQRDHKRNSVDSKRRTSVASESSLKYEYAPPTADSEYALSSPKEEVEDQSANNLEATATNTSTILDDMDKFQKEIEELRERYKHAA